MDPILASGEAIRNILDVRKLRLAMFMVFLLVLINFLGALAAYQSLQTLRASHGVRYALSQLLSTLQDAETGQRGFLLTGKDSYLEPFLAAEAQVEDSLLEAEAFFEGEDSELAVLAEVRKKAALKFDELRRTIAFMNSGDQSAAYALVATDEGKELMGEMRVLIGSLLAAQAQEKVLAQKRFDRNVILLTLMASISFFSFCACMWLLVRYLKQGFARQLAVEQSVLESQARLTMALEASGAGVWSWNIPENINTWDSRMESLFGLEAGSFQGNYEAWAEAVHPEDLAAAEALVMETVAERKPYDDVYRILRGEEVRHIRAIAKVICDPAGNPQLLTGICLDVTERILAEQQLQARHDQMLSLFDGIEEIIYVTDPNSFELLFVNQAFRENWGEEALGKKCHEVLQCEKSPCSFCTNDLIFGDNFGKVHIWEYQNPFNQRWYRCSDKGIRWHDGRQVRFELATDITGNKRIEQELKQAGEDMQLTLEASQVGLWSWDLRTQEQQWDSQVFALFDFAPETTPSLEAFKESLHPDDLERVSGDIAHAIKESGKYRTEYRVIWRDGSLHYILAMGRVDYDDQRTPLRMTGVCIDHTEKWLAEAKLQDFNEKLLQSNRELEQFAYVASHDLKEPLRQVSSFVQLLAEHYKEHVDETGERWIGYTTEGVSRMQRLIDDLLLYSRVRSQGKELSPLPLSLVMEEVLENLQLRLEEQEARVELEQEMPQVLGDYSQLVQLMQNLISNAVKFQAPESRPLIRIRVKPELEMTSGSLGSRSFWHIELEDNGIGIDPSHAERVFVIFQRLNSREKYEGTGIGLAVCKNIVDRHGGRIWVEAAPKGGSIFHVTLQAAQLPST